MGLTLFHFLHQPPTSKSCNKSNKDQCIFSNKSNSLSRKLKLAPTTLPVMVDNASTAFPASLSSAFASRSNQFIKTPSPFGGEAPVPLPLPKTPVRIIVEIVMDRAVSIVIPCSRNKIRILSANDASWPRTFAIICLILATCVWRSFRICDRISSLAYFSVFKSSDLSLCNCLCSSFSTSSNFLVSLLMRLSISVSLKVL